MNAKVIVPSESGEVVVSIAELLPNKSKIGVLAWESNGSDTLGQLESMQGNLLHPDTFKFDLILKRVPGANYKTIVESPCQQVLANMIAAAKTLENDGVKAITTSCGFNAIFQREIANELNIPFFSSSLMQVPLAFASIANGKSIGIITADKAHLSSRHLQAVGINDDMPIHIAGLDSVEEFTKLRNDTEVNLDTDRFIAQVTEVAQNLIAKHLDIGAIVLECTDLPPCKELIQTTTALPVWDIVTLINMVNSIISSEGKPNIN